jgi:glucosyl-3-phosphoglycerate synthase
MRVSVVVPGLNVAATIEGVVSAIARSDTVDEVILVDNGSEDETALRAAGAGASVVRCERRGLGSAMKAGICKVRNDFVVKVDGDIANPCGHWIDALALALSGGAPLCKGTYRSAYDQFPVATLVARPALRLTYPELDYVAMPLSGLYAFRRDLVAWSALPDNWAFDLAMLVAVHRAGGQVMQVDVGELNDHAKAIYEYADMAYDLLEFLFGSREPE